MKHERIAGAGIVVLVHFHVVIVGYVPAETVDEKLLAQAQKLVKRSPVAVLAQEIERDVVHNSLSKDGECS